LFLEFSLAKVLDYLLIIDLELVVKLEIELLYR